MFEMFEVYPENSGGEIEVTETDNATEGSSEEEYAVKLVRVLKKMVEEDGWKIKKMKKDLRKTRRKLSKLNKRLRTEFVAVEVTGKCKEGKRKEEAGKDSTGESRGDKKKEKPFLRCQIEFVGEKDTNKSLKCDEDKRKEEAGKDSVREREGGKEKERPFLKRLGDVFLKALPGLLTTVATVTLNMFFGRGFGKKRWRTAVT